MAHDEQITDESLMVRICEGDHQAFAIIVERYTDMFYAAAYRMCGNTQESEDVVQDALLKLWQKPHSFDPSKGVKLSTWLYRVVTNAAIDKMRKKKPEVDGDTVLDFTADERSAADEIMIEDEQSVAVERAIQALPERQKAALNLCFYEGLSNKEAAEILGVGVKALESLLMRAKAKLKDQLVDGKGEERKGQVDYG